MIMTQENQKILNWLNREQQKDKVELEINKKKFIQEIKKIKKEDIIKVPKKPSLWQKIKIMILGR